MAVVATWFIRSSSESRMGQVAAADASGETAYIHLLCRFDLAKRRLLVWLRYATICSIIILKERRTAMPTLHVRSIPDDLYDRIQSLAQARSRSLSSQVVTMLYEAADEEESRSQQALVLTSIRRRRFVPPVKSASSQDLLREDRQR